METNPSPNPGSDAAVAAGCTCAVMDNEHGRGYMGNPHLFCVTEGCPVHDHLVPAEDNQSEPPRMPKTTPPDYRALVLSILAEIALTPDDEQSEVDSDIMQIVLRRLGLFPDLSETGSREWRDIVIGVLDDQGATTLTGERILEEPEPDPDDECTWIEDTDMDYR